MERKVYYGENCFIYWDEDDKPERLIYIQCTECYKTNSRGRFWSGQDGYGGPVKCCNCGGKICG